MKNVTIGTVYSDPEGLWEVVGFEGESGVEITNTETGQECVVRASEAFYYVNGGDKMFDQAVELMDDEIREELHEEISPCDPDIFLMEYMRRHKERFGEDFDI